MAISIEAVTDFVNGCMPYVEKDRYTDLSLELNYKVASRLMAKGRKLAWSGSDKCEFIVKVRSEKNARGTGLYDEDVSNVVQMTDKGSMRWSMYTTNYSFDIREEIFLAKDWRLILDYIKVKDASMIEDFYELLEYEFWGKPVSSSQFPRPLAGIPAWVVPNGSVAGGARNGMNPAGFSDGIGGLDSNLYPRWRNWTFAHDGTVTYDGFIQRVTRAMDHCQFKPAHKTPALVKNNANSRYGLYCGRLLYESAEKHLRAQNDNLGRELAKEGPMIRQNSIEWVPVLDEYDSDNPSDGDMPFYGIDHNSIGAAKQRGLWMKRTKPKEASGSHNVVTVHMDSAAALVCHDRSANFVGNFMSA